MSIQPLKRPPEAAGSIEEQLEDIRTYLNILYRKVMTSGDEAVAMARAVLQSITEGNNPELANIYAATLRAKKIIVSDDLTDGQTIISGDNIQTGTIAADYIDVAELIVRNALIIASDLTDGHTVISGDNILTGRILAQYINGDSLDVKNANIENCTINNQCTINAPIQADTIASNTNGSSTGTLEFSASGYKLQQNYGVEKATLKTYATSTNVESSLTSFDGTNTAEVKAVVNRQTGKSRVDLNADDILFNGYPFLEVEQRQFFDPLLSTPVAGTAFDFTFFWNHPNNGMTRYARIEFGSETPTPSMYFITADETAVAVTDPYGDWNFTGNTTIYVPNRPFNSALNAFLTQNAPAL